MVTPWRQTRVLTALAALLLAACGGGQAPTATPTTAAVGATPIATAARQPTATAQPPATPTATPTARPAAAPVKITMALFALQGPVMDPVKASVTSRTDPYVGAMFDGLIGADQDNNIEPALAKEWSFSPDGLNWDFKLRPAKFHDGSPVTAEDAKFSSERYVKEAPPAGLARRNFDRGQVVTPDTVRFIMKAPWPPAVAGFGGIYPRAYFERVGADQFGKNPVGAGPFRFVRAEPDVVEMQAFRDYWDGAPAVSQLIVREVPEESTRVAMLKTGEADLIEVAGKLLEDALRAPGAKVISSQAAVYVLIHLYGARNPDHPFYNLKLRQALNYAINKEAILKVLYSGYGEVMASQPFPSSKLRSAPDIKPYPYDPDKARALLKEAGFGAGVTFPVYTTTTLKDLTVAVQADLAKVGVKLEPINFMERGQWVTMRAANAGVNQTKVTGIYPVDTTPPGFFTYASVDTFYGSKGIYSPHDNAELDKLVERANLELDVRKREALEIEMARIINKEALNVFLVTQDYTFVVGPKIADWKPTQGRRTPTRLETIVPSR